MAQHGGVLGEWEEEEEEVAGGRRKEYLPSLPTGQSFWRLRQC